MPEVAEYRWVCRNPDRLDQLDAEITEFTGYLSGLSGFVADEVVTGQQCISLERQFKAALKQLRAERSSLWMRIKVKEKGGVEQDEVGDAPRPLMGVRHISKLETL